MKITGIKCFPIWSGFRNILIVKVETDEGVYGVGESGVSSRELAVQGIISHFAQFLIGKDARRIGAIWQEMYRGQYFEGGRIITGAISAIDIALHDAVARSYGIPVYQLLGGAQRERVPCFATSRVAMGPASVEEAERLKSEGWSAIRFFPAERESKHPTKIFEPRESLSTTAKWLRKIRESIGDSTVIGIDYHHRLNVAEAISFCERLPVGTIDFLEEPIRAENVEAYAALRQSTGIPFAVGEEFASKWAFLPFIERGLTNFARVDICNVGGFTEAMKVAGWCEAHYIDMMPHNPLGPISTAAHIQFGAAVPNFAWLEVLSKVGVNAFKFDRRIFPNLPKIDGNSYEVPKTPGLGVDFNEEYAKESFRFWEPPRWHKSDGSYTNW